MMVDDAVTMAEYLRIDHRYIDGTMTGGSSFEFHVQHLAAAIRDGAVRHRARHLRLRPALAGWAAASAPAAFSAACRQVAGPDAVTRRRTATRSSARTRCTRSATCTSTARRRSSSPRSRSACASTPALNPNAMYRDPITVDDVVDSRMIADPLHMLDCCAITDGGGAFIMTTAERAKDLTQPPVYVLGACRRADALEHLPADRLHDVGRRAGRARWRSRRRASRHDDVDMLMFYDSFTITCLLLLECARLRAQGRGRPVRRRGAPQAGREVAAQHRRWRALVVPPRDARHLPDHRGGAPAAGPGRRGPGARLRGRARGGLRRLALAASAS